MQVSDQEKKRWQEEGETNRVLGLFLVFFGATLLIAIFFTGTATGKLINLACGAVLAGIGGGMTYFGQKKINRAAE